jgi:hypothetical protein
VSSHKCQLSIVELSVVKLSVARHLVHVTTRAVTSPPLSGKLALKLSECSYPGVLLVACRQRCANIRSIRLGISVVPVALGIFHGIP